jgi:hypothetical protein
MRAEGFDHGEAGVRQFAEADERFIELMYRAEEVVSESGQLPEELFAEITDYLEAFRTKVDSIAGYWRWQESIAAICGQEVERLSARKKAAEGRVTRLKNMLLEFMTTRGLKRLEGDKTSVALQANSSASLVVDDPLQIGDGFLESAIRFTKTELQEIVYQMTDGELRWRLELALEAKEWEINNSAIRAAIANNDTDWARRDAIHRSCTQHCDAGRSLGGARETKSGRPGVFCLEQDAFVEDCGGDRSGDGRSAPHRLAVPGHAHGDDSPVARSLDRNHLWAARRGTCLSRLPFSRHSERSETMASPTGLAGGVCGRRALRNESSGEGWHYSQSNWHDLPYR